MCENESGFASRVSNLCNELYNCLAKKGKPEKGREWTKMACIVKSSGKCNLEVVSLATGTKCIGKSLRSKNGTILNDSHAEILARRLLLKYIYKELGLPHDTPKDDIFDICDESSHLYKLKKDVQFHLYTTDTPCGDASIFPAGTDDQCTNKRKCVESTVNVKRTCCESVASGSICPNSSTERDQEDAYVSGDNCISDRGITQNCYSRDIGGDTELSNCVPSTQHVIDIHRTGAKCVPKGKQDLHGAGANYHETGVLRIKPGRGERTVSMSCSDKIMKWCVLGVNGGLLSNFLEEPIFLSSIIIGGDEVQYASMIRALTLRGRNIDNKVKTSLPKVLFCRNVFDDGVQAIEQYTNPQVGSRRTPSGTAILWCKSCGIHEVSSQGRKHGITKKDLDSPKAATVICKKNLFKDFMGLLELSGNSFNLNKETLTYFQYKHMKTSYENVREEFFNLFPDWSGKCKEEEDFILK